MNNMLDINSLKTKIWDAANNLRGNIHATEYKDYIISLIFYKSCSDKIITRLNKDLNFKKFYQKEYWELNENDKNYNEIIETVKEHMIKTLGYFLSPKHTYEYILLKSRGKITSNDTIILEDLHNAFMEIEKTYPDNKLQNVFESADLFSSKLGTSTKEKNGLVVKILEIFENDANGNKYNFSEFQNDIIGEIYEYLLAEFASHSGKKGGEFYTPHTVSKLKGKLIAIEKENNKYIHSIYDPTCGSGSLLLHTYKELEPDKVEKIYGQEINPTTYNYARMNMVIHDISPEKWDIKRGDTLKNDLFKNEKFEVIVSNPPFSLKWLNNDAEAKEFETDERFVNYGAIAPKNKADYAFVQHIEYHLMKDKGIASIVLPLGVLFRENAEKTIRKYLVEKNLINYIIELPENIFYGTTAPVCIMGINKNKKDDKILFINASKEYKPGKKKNILEEKHIEKILNAVKERKNIDKFSRLVDLKEIQENDYNLNVSRYISLFEEEKIDIEKIENDLLTLKQEEKNVLNELNTVLGELGLKQIF